MADANYGLADADYGLADVNYGLADGKDVMFYGSYWVEYGQNDRKMGCLLKRGFNFKNKTDGHFASKVIRYI
ncbi:MAG: hypothetical protein IT246_09140 [Bacteroidia bacterium]|nr:hypothetical protein [Bacteroidia bacterium]